MRIEIGEPTHSLNDLRNKFKHFQAYKRERDRWHYLVREQVGPPTGNAIDKCEITVTRYGHNLLDPDNLSGGCKILLDCLSRNGVITDDRAKVIKKFITEQEIDRSNPRTVVEIVPIP